MVRLRIRVDFGPDRNGGRRPGAASAMRQPQRGFQKYRKWSALSGPEGRSGCHDGLRKQVVGFIAKWEKAEMGVVRSVRTPVHSWYSKPKKPQKSGKNKQS
jgi:hypothetical protein